MPTATTDKTVYLYLDSDIESMVGDSAVLDQLKAELLELMKLDPELFELEIEVFSGSVVIRLTIRSTQPGMAEQTGQALLDYLRDTDGAAIGRFAVKAGSALYGNWTTFINANRPPNAGHNYIGHK